MGCTIFSNLLLDSKPSLSSATHPSGKVPVGLSQGEVPRLLYQSRCKFSVNLLFAVSRALHGGSPILVWENSHFRRSSFRGLRQGEKH